MQQIKEEKIKLNENNILEIVDKELGDSLESSTVEIFPFEEYMNSCVVSETVILFICCCCCLIEKKDASLSLVEHTPY